MRTAFRYAIYGLLACGLLTGGKLLASPEPPPPGYSTTANLIIR
jgi:hypothetical protein